MPVSRQLAAEFELHRDDLIEAWHPATTIGEPTRTSIPGHRPWARGRSRLAAATTFLAAALSLATAAPVDATAAADAASARPAGQGVATGSTADEADAAPAVNPNSRAISS